MDSSPTYPSSDQPSPVLGTATPIRLYQPPPLRKVPKQKVWLHVFLFLATVASTTYIGGWQYSACLMLILTCHEFGHYFAARKHRVPASLPYFIPAPFPQIIFGTFGAVIRMSPYIPNRRALFDIAAAGPIAGIIVALPVALAGMFMSTLQPKSAIAGLELGNPLLLQAMEWWVFGSSSEVYDVVPHPVAFAGWVGLFVTALNLLPIGQLDGGHIVHAVFGKNSRYISGGVFALLAGVTLWPLVAPYLGLTPSGGASYIIFLALLFFMGIQHPPTLNESLPLGRRRTFIAIIMLIIFILCFTPTPIQG
jgi:membrane-associated protease RseP (regulator of RpoE activity)